MDFEKEAEELGKMLPLDGFTPITDRSTMALFLRQFAARVLREEIRVMKVYDVTGTAERYLERRATEIERR